MVIKNCPESFAASLVADTKNAAKGKSKGKDKGKPSQAEPEVCLFLGHLSHSGDLLLWVGVRRRASSVVI